MKAWDSIASLIREVHAVSGPHRRRTGDELRVAAVDLAAHIHGDARVFQLPALINITALALEMPRVVTHVVRPAAVEAVAATDLHSLPDAPPSLLARAVIVESASPSDVLIGSGVEGRHTCSIGCYPIDGTYYLVGLFHPDGVITARWTPTWEGGDLAAGIVPERVLTLASLDADAHAEWTRDAARLLVVLGLMLDARATPLRVRDEGPQIARRTHGVSHPARPWAVRYVHLHGESQRGTSSPAEIASLGPVEGRRLEPVPVRGHLRRQRCGPRGELREWIYIAAHQARRWVAPMPTRVVVDTR